uniref:Receptor expression-enhancing protein n=1 Tax=Chromera velia CCMP2878 TaxID=1169474 RepID=A0A0G4FGB8_9ALVE|eukprot:Cvel_16806.t1-p1 / transcript=Cvel_16806.t1 / gene=Cvel_16806 / organism=Chromera_velia_CCMP2878 / gene_product=Receptor expression-enhancing protein 5, putative / transcript_product=Receptor expression-enhancing protein 5, putative / location=Cvel_scaffold1312:40319-42810(-) / protein_length=264 / sequence_SO=supercontig / SO=protein_coding / is_pseudo=false
MSAKRRKQAQPNEGAHQKEQEGASGGSPLLDQIVKKATNVAKNIDNRAQRVPIIIKMSNAAGVAPHVIVISVIFFLLAFMLFGIGGELICNWAGFIYPAYKSFKAIESRKKEEDKLWLTYWVVYALFSTLEVFADIILFWVPFYYLCKLVFLIWCMHPSSKGSVVCYNNLVRPFLMHHQKAIDGAFEDVRKSIGGAANQGVSALEELDVGVVVESATRQFQKTVGGKGKGVVKKVIQEAQRVTSTAAAAAEAVEPDEEEEEWEE